MSVKPYSDLNQSASSLRWPLPIRVLILGMPGKAVFDDSPKLYFLLQGTMTVWPQAAGRALGTSSSQGWLSQRWRHCRVQPWPQHLRRRRHGSRQSAKSAASSPHAIVCSWPHFGTSFRTWTESAHEARPDSPEGSA